MGIKSRLCRTDLVEDHLTQLWLREEADKFMAINSAYGGTVAAGMIARLWSMPGGASPEDLQRMTEAVMRNDGPRDRAIAWFRKVVADDQSLGQILKHAATLQIWLRDECVEIANRLDQAGSLDVVGDGFTRAAHWSVRWLLERDQLESIQHMLASVDLGQEFEGALRLLDSENAEPMQLICRRIGNLPPNPHLQTVSFCEPDAWWGTIAKHSL